ncbi:MAG: acetyl-CoA carboxylase carboxyl transferase subunit alpha/beta, partial [Myxococcales bacterium]
MARLSAHDLIDLVLDEGSWQSWDEAPEYPDASDAYLAELARAAEKAGTDESLITGVGTLRGREVAV